MTSPQTKLDQISRQEQRTRYYRLIRRFIEAQDSELTDSDLVRAVWLRWRKARDEYIIDPNE